MPRIPVSTPSKRVKEHLYFPIAQGVDASGRPVKEVILMRDPVERRALAAFRCVSSITGDTITAGLTVISHLPIWQNRSATYVIYESLRDDPRAGAHGWSFVSSLPSNLEVSISDASGRYLPRSANLPARNAAQRIRAGGDPATLFNPQSVVLFPSPSWPISSDWAVVRISVRMRDVVVLPGAVVQVSASGTGAVLATTMTDARGEGLLAIPQLAPQTAEEVMVTAWFDPSCFWVSKARHWDPDKVLNDVHSPALKMARIAARIAPGQVVNETISISP